MGYGISTLVLPWCVSFKGSMYELRYVGVIWFVFHVFQLLPNTFTQEYSFCISKSTGKHLSKSGLKIGSPMI